MPDSDGYFFFVPSRSVWEEFSDIVKDEGSYSDNLRPAPSELDDFILWRSIE